MAKSFQTLILYHYKRPAKKKRESSFLLQHVYDFEIKLQSPNKQTTN